MQVRVLSGQRNERERERGDGKRQARPLPSFLPSFPRTMNLLHQTMNKEERMTMRLVLRWRLLLLAGGG